MTNKNPNPKVKSLLLFIVKLLVTAGLVVWFIFKINWLEVLADLQKISLDKIVIYLTVLLISIGISACKWRMLARFKGFKITLVESFQFYLTGTFVNNFMPSFIGGDTYRGYMLGKPQKRFHDAAATVVIDRITGLLAVMLLSIFFGVINFKNIFLHPILWLLLLAIFGGLSFLFLLEKTTKYRFGKKITALIPSKILGFLKILHEYYLDKKIFSKAILFAVLFSLIGLGLQNWVIFWALGIKISVLNYLSVIFLISIVSSLPISINNIGVQEWAYVTFFGFFGASSAEVITVSIVIRILQMIVSFTALPMYLKRKYVKENE